MTTAEDFRVDPPRIAPERDLLQGLLDYHRGTLLWKVAGLTGDELVTASIDPSVMTLLGLVRHLTEVERYWFQLCLAGQPVKLDLWTDEHPDGDFELVDAARVEEDLAAFRETVRLSNELASGYDLDYTFSRPNYDSDYSLRHLYIHLVEEYARHNGHADLLRERIDGRTGD